MDLVRDRSNDGEGAATEEHDSGRGTLLEDGSRVIEGDEAGPESEGRVPNLDVGQRVVVTDGEFKGRMAYVLRIEYANNEAFLQAGIIGHPERRFAEVAHYIVKTRDGRTDQFSVTPEQIEPINENDGWGRGRI